MTKTKKSYDSLPIQWLETTDSTNSDVRRGLDTLANLSVIAARFQTAGRGQGSHTWLSPRDENLTFSILLRFGKDAIPEFPASEAVRITQVATLAVHDFLLSEGVESRIKWPNDIWVGERKICGMLIENILDGALVRSSIVGIGINLNQDCFDPSLPNPVSLSMLTGRHYPLEDTLILLYKKICRRVALLGTSDGYNELEMDFNRYLFHLERSRQEALSEAIEGFEAIRQPLQDL
jgi:BirA family biotin operon repressor/biotin-[acetyl-CoA-carboxylase] ligase